MYDFMTYYYRFPTRDCYMQNFNISGIKMDVFNLSKGQKM
jgi:hypothetical protein